MSLHTTANTKEANVASRVSRITVKMFPFRADRVGRESGSKRVPARPPFAHLLNRCPTPARRTHRDAIRVNRVLTICSRKFLAKSNVDRILQEILVTKAAFSVLICRPLSSRCEARFELDIHPPREWQNRQTDRQSDLMMTTYDNLGRCSIPTLTRFRRPPPHERSVQTR